MCSLSFYPAFARPLFRFACFPWSLLFVAGLLSGASIPVERTPPPIYAEAIEPLLTPIEEILSRREAFPEATTGGIDLIKERIIHVTEAGTIYRLQQIVYTARDRAGVEELEKSIFTYDKDREHLYLIDAYTLQADDTRLDVAENAAFIQTPQHEASNSLYTSEAELSLLYPDVRVGSTTVAVVLWEEFDPVMPGEFVSRRGFGAGWPVCSLREVVELPADYARRLKIVANSVRTPEPSREELEGGRIRLTWEMANEPKHIWEASSPSFFEQLPSVYCSTLPDWKTVADWFNGLTASRREIPEALEAEVAKWIEGLEDQEQILRTIHRHIAQDIRYTGLEFGLAGYQPYSCADVWANRYGDCKDKANLLATLLRAQGIDAYVTLLMTLDHGYVEKRSPSWSGFNHAIVAVRRENGDWLFCDPTVRYLEAGVLPFGDTARDVFVVTPEGGEWVQIPDERSGGITVGVDVALEASGEISGWMTLRGDGCDAAWYFQSFIELEPHERQRRAQQIFGGFFPGVRVMDVDFDPTTFVDGVFTLRAYVVRDAASGALEALRFPFPQSWLPSLDDERKRETNYQAYRRFEAVEGTIELPEGISVASLPEPFAASFSGAEFTASWEVESPSQVAVKLRWEPHQAILSPVEFGSYRRAVFALKSWLDRPLPLGGGGAVAVSTEPNVLDEHDFPLLATGEGQFNLLDERFPAKDHPELYREGLRRILQWFPDDVETVFTARMRLLVADWNDENDAETALAVQALLDQLGDRVTLNNLTWAQYIWARAVHDDSNDPAGIEMLRSLVENEDVSTFRRAWSAYFLGKYLLESDREEALAIWDEWENLQSDAQKTIVSEHLRELLRGGAVEALTAYLEKQDELFGAEIDEAIFSRIRILEEMWRELPVESRGPTLKIFKAYLDAHPELTKAAEQWKKSALDPRFEAQRERFVVAYGKLLREVAPPWWKTEVSEEEAESEAATETDAASVEDLMAELEEANKANDLERVLVVTSRILLRPEASSGEFHKAGYYALWWLLHREAYPKIESYLRVELPCFPVDSENWIFATLTELEDSSRKQGKLTMAAGYAREILKRDSAPGYRRAYAAGELAEMAMLDGDAEAARAMLATTYDVFTSHVRQGDFFYLDLVLTLDAGDFERGRQLLEEIRKIDDKYIKQARFEAALQHLRKFEDPEALVTWWQGSGEWWSEWERFARGFGIEPYALKDYLVIAKLDDHRTRLKELRKERDETELAKCQRVYAMAARWIPAFLGDLTKPLIYEYDGFFWKDAVATREAAIGILEAIPELPEGRSAIERYNAGTAYWILGRPEEGARLFRDCANSEGLRESERLGMQQTYFYWVFRASRARVDVSEPMAAIRQEIEAGRWSFEPDERLPALARDLITAGEIEEARSLLEVMESSLEDQAETAALRGVREILQRHDADAAAAEEMTAKVGAWIEAHDLAWLHAMPPFDLTDYRFADGSGPYFPNAALPDHEAVKANFLVALDASRPFEKREDAFLYAVNSISDLTGENRTTLDLFLSAIQVVGETHSSNQRFRFGRLIDLALFRNNWEEAEKCLASAWANDLDRSRRELLRARAESLRIFETMEGAEVAKAAESLLEHPLNVETANQISEILFRLVYNGFSDEATKLFDRTEGCQVEATSTRSLASYRLAFLDMMRRAEQRRPLYQRIRQLLGVNLPRSADLETGERVYRRLKSIHDLDNLHPDELGGLARYVFRTGKFRDVDPIRLAALALRASLRLGDSDRPVGQMLEWLLAEDPHQFPDFADSFKRLIGRFDIDQPAVCEWRKQAVENFLHRHPDQDAVRREWISQQAYETLRTASESESFPLALFGADASANVSKNWLMTMRLIYHFARGQDTALDNQVRDLNFGGLNDMRSLAIVLPRLESTGREAEMTLLVEWIETVRLELLAAAYSADRGWAIARLFEAAVVLRHPDWFPPELEAFLETHSRDPLDQSRYAAYAAFLREDWEKTITAASRALQFAPDYYELMGLRGIARWHLGDMVGAKADLGVSTRFGGNELLRPQAIEILSELP